MPRFKIALDKYIRVLQFSLGTSAISFGVRHLCAAFLSISSSPRKGILKLRSPVLRKKSNSVSVVVLTSKSFRCNTYWPPPMCCKQRSYAILKFFRCNTYKKEGGTLGSILAVIPQSRDLRCKSTF